MFDSRRFAGRSTTCLLAVGTVLVSLLVPGCGEGTPSPANSATFRHQRPDIRLDYPMGLTTALDRRVDRLWLVGDDAAYLFDARSKRKLGRVQLDGWIFIRPPYGCAPAILIRESGAVLVSSNVVPMIWEVDPIRLAATRHPVLLVSDDGKDVGITGLAQSGNGRIVFGTNGVGTLWRVDTETWTAYPIHLDRPLPPGGCLVSIREATDARDPVALCVHSDGEGSLVILDSQFRRGMVVANSCTASIVRQRTARTPLRSH